MSIPTRYCEMCEAEDALDGSELCAYCDRDTTEAEEAGEDVDAYRAKKYADKPTCETCGTILTPGQFVECPDCFAAKIDGTPEEA